MKTKIRFQAYIPKSLGKPLYDYFKNDHRLKNLKNKEDFIRQLKSCDSEGYHWIPEPYQAIKTLFCSTDTVDYTHNEHCAHSIRLGFQIEIDINKISRNYPNTPSDILKHDTYCTMGKHLHQHSGFSHKVEAYIKDNMGYVKKHTPRRSEEKPLICTFKRSHPYFGKEKDRYRKIDIIVKASANYPYRSGSPDIDFEMVFTIERKSIQNGDIKSINNGRITCRGTHNAFPAYELVIDDARIYHYKPKDSGPGILNLTLFDTEFQCSKYV